MNSRDTLEGIDANIIVLSKVICKSVFYIISKQNIFVVVRVLFGFPSKYRAGRHHKNYSCSGKYEVFIAAKIFFDNKIYLGMENHCIEHDLGKCS